MAYARRWIRQPASDSSLVAQSPWGWFGTIPRDRAAALLDALEETWTTGTSPPTAFRRARRLAAGLYGRLALGAGRAVLQDTLRARLGTVFLLVSHRSLQRQAPIAALRQAGARFVPLIHDLIPLTHPEYARPRQTTCHAGRIATAAAQADGIIVNSAATAAVLRPHLAPHGRPVPPLVVAPLGIDLHRQLPLLLPTEPYFVCLGTIEPRKNHLLLLHLWRQLAARAASGEGPPPPRLLVVGRRGWENENIIDLLDRCETLRGLVQEIATPPDRRVATLLAGASALLYPSFVEGYGLPVAEALALGVPVICSDLPALREVGGAVPDYLDPLDGLAWRRLIEAYAEPGSAPRAAQLARLQHWSAPHWDDHFAHVDSLLEQVVSSTRPAGHLLPEPRRVPVAAATAIPAA